MTLRAASPSSETILLATLGGAVLGALAMALLTPKTGREVRATLRTAARRFSGGGGAQAELDDLIEASFI